MTHIKKALLSLLFVTTFLNASTMYTLSGIKKVYPVVEISGKKVPQSYKDIVFEELQSVTDDLKIDTKGFDQRSLAVMISEQNIDKKTVIHMQLVIGEEVKRLDSNATVFALTYQSKEQFVLESEDALEEEFEDALDTLLLKFSDQYAEENKSYLKVATDEKDFAKSLGYEINFDEAVKKSKKQQKNIMLVLASNYCPWCRKFEERVLMKKEVNDLIQKKYIPLILNKEKDGFPKQFDDGFTPIVHFLDHKTQKSYKKVIGYNNRDKFQYIIKTDNTK